MVLGFFTHAHWVWQLWLLDYHTLCVQLRGGSPLGSCHVICTIIFVPVHLKHWFEQRTGLDPGPGRLAMYSLFWKNKILDSNSKLLEGFPQPFLEMGFPPCCLLR